MPRTIKWEKLPVISQIRTVPVIGARTEAEKNAAMAIMIILGAWLASISWKESRTPEQMLPVSAPNTSMGRKNPPGTPVP